MAIPNYTTDLTDINLCDSTGDTLYEFTNYDQGTPDTPGDTDYFIQGIACHTAQQKNKTGLQSIAIDFGTTITIPTGHAIFMWMVLLAGNAIEVVGNGGYRIIAGNDTTNFKAWNVGGRNFGRNPYGGWSNFAAAVNEAPEDDSNGTQTTWQYFGTGANLISGIKKGNLHGLDAIRYGRGALIVSGGELGDYATFEGMSEQNDEQSNRWGLFQDQSGAKLWKGLMQFGTGHDSINSVEFVDSNVSITIDDAPSTYREFNKIEFNNQNSIIDWTNISIASLSSSGGLLSLGQLEVIDDCTLNFDTCQFTDMDRHIYLSNSILDGCTYRRCYSVVQNGAFFDECVFDSARVSGGDFWGTAALSANDLDLIQYCDFIQRPRQGAHAIACNVSGSYDFYGNLFDGYGISGSPSAAFYNNSGGDITLNILDGGDPPTVYNAPDGSHTNVVVAVSYTLTGIVSGSEVQIVTQEGENSLYHLENTTEDDGTGRGTTKAVYSYSYSDDLNGVDTPIYIYVHNVDYKWTRVIDILTSLDKITPVQQAIDPWYNNP